MEPLQTGKHYDQLAAWWQKEQEDSTYGVAQLERAISFAAHRGLALDVGCGSSPRYFNTMIEAGFQPEGMDASAEMLELARKNFPDHAYYFGDITDWAFPKTYDLITAWDSTFHLPLSHQKPALVNMCHGLNANGVLLFTCGGVETPGEITDTMEGLRFDYSALGLSNYLKVLMEQDCAIRHVEYDQGADGRHVYIIAQKVDSTTP